MQELRELQAAPEGSRSPPVRSRAYCSAVIIGHRCQSRVKVCPHRLEDKAHIHHRYRTRGLKLTCSIDSVLACHQGRAAGRARPWTSGRLTQKLAQLEQACCLGCDLTKGNLDGLDLGSAARMTRKRAPEQRPSAPCRLEFPGAPRCKQLECLSCADRGPENVHFGEIPDSAHSLQEGRLATREGNEQEDHGEQSDIEGMISVPEGNLLTCSRMRKRAAAPLSQHQTHSAKRKYRNGDGRLTS